MTETGKTRVDLRIIRTRQLIKNALIDLLQEMDISKITVNRIAERATINRVTFYLHYKDIQDMLEKMAEEMAEDIKHIIRKPITTGKFDKDVKWIMLEHLLEYIAENAKFYKVVLGTRRTPIFTERLLNVLTELVRERTEILSSINPNTLQRDIVIWYGSSALIGTISFWLRNDMPYTPQYLAKQLSMIFQASKK
ncbi:TetR/AcrR family transcriptional regulator C-terminal domain-containing protein [Bacillus sp. 165]|uniref:TetR/AcrR family transcriptional regulator n=1 Tax=Bacillus sp. 165 TaxID=1529117 RepID=UPI001ADD336F|nr:TetR/AcrR family transcriptional regulator C-terminal domain-containing protein [Bacillus sp. 165]